ncbi:ComEC/Rec2 family competence protein [Spiroplasma tabanidicola]|uniref:Competence protein ComEC n=1 Tax=Spiroplasma tabanidicola TaxID=324079 RepID=A0A6I6C6Y5_9MOLU|nr:ComEC/Rec2 family competence protein [Spiroplasma tabanidicola]QGS51960.1 competence protein ComEC [Spiroplasma tabanidicola]
MSEVKEKYVILVKGFKQYLVWKGDANFSVGEVVKAVGEVKKLNVYGNFWSFNFNKYLNDKNVNESIEYIKILKVFFKDPRYYFFKLNHSENNLANLLLFQNKSNDEVYKNLINLSLSYLSNISGVYLYLFVVFIKKLISKKYKKNRMLSFISLIFMFFYCYLIGMPPTLLKVLIGFLLNKLKKYFNFNLNKITKLSITWFIVLFINPMYLFNIGFVYCTIAILLLKKYKDRKESTNLIINFIVINLVFIPLNIIYDFKIYWLAQIQEIILLPLFFLSFILSFFFVLPFLNPLLNFDYNLLKFTVIFFSKYNLTSLTGYINFGYIIIYYLSLYFLTKFIIFNKKIKFFLYSMLTFSLIGMYFTNTIINIFSQTIEMLNVGNGNSFMINYNSNIFVIDAGAGVGQNKSTLPDYLKYKGLNKIQSVFISHNHSDHYNSLEQLKKETTIKYIYRNLKKDILVEFDDIKFYIFNEYGNSDENDNSQIIVVKLNNQTFLFTGDASKKREARMLNNSLFLELVKNGVDLYQVGHHGSKTATSDKFVKAIKPKICFISGMKKDKLQFPSKETINTLEDNSCQNYITNGEKSYKYKIKSKKVVEIKKEFI